MNLRNIKRQKGLHIMAGLAQEITTSPNLHDRLPSSTSTNPCHRDFSMSSSWYFCFSSVDCVVDFLVALSNLIWLYRSLPWNSQPSIADYPKYRALHRWLHKVQITVHGDYTKWRSQIKPDRSKQAKRQGDTMESVYWFHGG